MPPVFATVHDSRKKTDRNIQLTYCLIWAARPNLASFKKWRNACKQQVRWILSLRFEPGLAGVYLYSQNDDIISDNSDTIIKIYLRILFSYL